MAVTRLSGSGKFVQKKKETITCLLIVRAVHSHLSEKNISCRDDVLALKRPTRPINCPAHKGRTCSRWMFGNWLDKRASQLNGKRHIILKERIRKTENGIRCQAFRLNACPNNIPVPPIFPFVWDPTLSAAGKEPRINVIMINIRGFFRSSPAALKAISRSLPTSAWYWELQEHWNHTICFHPGRIPTSRSFVSSSSSKCLETGG